MVTHNDYSWDIYTVTVRRCNIQTSVEEYKYEEKPKGVFIVPGESISKKEPINTPEKKKMHVYIVPAAHNLFCQ